MPSITLGSTLSRAAQALKSRFEAELLMMQVLAVSRSYLLAHPEYLLQNHEQFAFNHLVERRLTGEPIAYLSGQQDFWSLSLEVSPATLIPRPETEGLVELVLATLDANTSQYLADLGTGSGAIALSLATERPHWQVTATDQSPQTLAVCERNRQRLGLSNVSCHLGNWCEALPHRNYQAIISNPPYIAEHDPHLSQGDLRFEPQAALVGGKEGLDAYRQIIPASKDYLQEDGWLFFEHGYTQAAAISHLLEASGFSHIQTYCDLAGLERITVGRKKR